MTTAVAPGFAWRGGPTGRTLTCDSLSFAPHLFTTRDVALREPADEHRLAQALNVDAEHLLRVHQVHGREVALVTPRVSLTRGTAADAIVSTDPTFAVAVLVADCVPILIADRHHRVVAAIHAGWRGTAAGIVSATVDAIGALGIVAGDLVAAVGPSAGPCCYQVDAVVRDAFLARLPRARAYFTPDGPANWKLDLWRANVDQLVDANVPAAAVFNARLCTIEHPETCFSYRRDGVGTGRLAAAIKLPSVR